MLIKTGYDLSFKRYFCKLQPLRSLEAVRTDILALEQETEGLLDEIVGVGRANAATYPCNSWNRIP